MNLFGYRLIKEEELLNILRDLQDLGNEIDNKNEIAESSLKTLKAELQAEKDYGTRLTIELVRAQEIINELRGVSHEE